MSYLDGISWIVWNGVNSIDYQLTVQKLPTFKIGEERVETFDIPGRDGTLHISDGSYGSYQAKCEMTMLDDAQRSDIFAWLKGSGILSTSDDPEHCVRARVVSKIDPERIVPSVRSFVVTFECQPYRYGVSPETVSLTASGTIYNPGTADCYPIMTVTGTGTVTIDSDAYVFTETSVTVNSEIEECYNGSTNKNSTVTGGFPVLTPGVHTVTLGTGITAVSILMNARWF